MENDNLKLWHSVEKTNPAYTKNAKVSGREITAIAPQYQIMQVTEQFGVYGEKWGFKNINLSYELVEKCNLVVFKGTFFFPNGEFEIINSAKLYMDRANTMVDSDFAKKIETDTLTKAISKLGFNADIFMGKFDDTKYVEEMKEEFKSPEEKAKQEAVAKEQQALQEIANTIAKFEEIEGLKVYYTSLPKEYQLLFKKQVTDKKSLLTPKQ